MIREEFMDENPPIRMKLLTDKDSYVDDNCGINAIAYNVIIHLSKVQYFQ